MSGGVVSLLRCVFFYFCREHKLVPPQFGDVWEGWLALQSWHSSQRSRQRDKSEKKIISERHHPVASDEKTVGWFFIHMGIECTIEKSHKPSVLKHHIVLLNGGNKGGKQTVRPQFVVRDIFRLCCAVMDAVVGVELRDCQIVFALQWQWLLWLSTDVFWVTPPLPLLDLNHSYLIIFKQVFKCHVSTVI